MDALFKHAFWQFALAMLAAWQIVETLRHGSIFAYVRRWANDGLDYGGWLHRKICKLLVCPFCLSHWAPLLPLLVMCYGPAWTKLLVASLAVTRTTQLLNDLSHGISRSPPSDEEIVIDETEKVEGSNVASPVPAKPAKGLGWDHLYHP